MIRISESIKKIATPLYLIGVVSSNGQEQEYKDTVTKTVDDMIKTLRDGK